MDEKKQIEIMAATIKPVKDLLNKRMLNKVELLNTLSANTLDTLPESIKLKREEEAARVRAVIQEQKDLIEIINALFPDE
ncbi:hypothetical protein [Flavobacterium sp. 25HG05S-40]|uniref:hypothetical protein n=1 Tax=Flavobacterium sp. 25HG05S-40 TaxID=3458682 RepID=UPI004044CCCF